MSRLVILASALEYMESNLANDIKTEDVAGACFCSKSTLEKLFYSINHVTVREYIIKRRMMIAARMLSSDEQISILDVALSVGYSSNEAFARAFKQVWNCIPSEFRKNKKRYTELFPRIRPPMESGDDYMRERRCVDISQLYDLLKERSNCFFVCCDIKHMMEINDVSHKAGDIAILEVLKRLEDVAGPEDVPFRIGGDEFVILTGSEEESYAQELVSRLEAMNGKCFEAEGREIPLVLHVTKTRMGDVTVRYAEVFSRLHGAIKECKR
ncbi:MAG: helix-turn-helix domain-containing protein [Lachnospiraceae bacterium]|nr:helix-turn-helix domain-containing protein [Lachnospiraceae bacterium]